MRTLTLALIAGLFGSSAWAQTSNYNLSLSTFQADFNCTISTASAGSQQCSVTEGSQGNVSLTMSPSDDPNMPGFAGALSTNDANGEYSLAVIADPSQTVQWVLLERDTVTSDGSVLNASLSIVATAGVEALNITPLTVQMPDSQTYIITGTVFIYAPASTSNMANNKDHTALNNYLVSHLKPIVLAKKLAKH